MNNDLISRSELKKVITANHYLLSARNNSIDYGMFTTGIMQAIDNAPTVEITETEIQEVLNKRCMTAVANEYLIALHGKRPQGEWVDTGDMQEYWAEEYQCSICGAKDHWHNFCPNCGAKMKGDRE